MVSFDWLIKRFIPFAFLRRHLERTRIALDIERNMSIAERKLPRNKYWVVVQGERYLQVEQVNNELFNVKEDETDED